MNGGIYSYRQRCTDRMEKKSTSKQSGKWEKNDFLWEREKMASEYKSWIIIISEMNLSHIK